MRVVATALALIATAASTDKHFYCPNENDLGYDGSVNFSENGYSMIGPGNVHGFTSFNLLGGYVSFTMNTTKAGAGVNTNLYLISPENGVSESGYCDIQANDTPQCMEMDLVENNGNCLMASTWHVYPDEEEYNETTYGDCDEWGCAVSSVTPDSFTINATFSESGWMTTIMNGQVLSDLQPYPSDEAVAKVAETMNRVGAAIWSSQWAGWVPGGPGDGCPDFPGDDDTLNNSEFKVEDLVVFGTVVQGPEPSLC